MQTEIPAQEVINRLTSELGAALQRAVIAETAQDYLQAELDKLKEEKDESTNS